MGCPNYTSRDATIHKHTHSMQNPAMQRSKNGKQPTISSFFKSSNPAPSIETKENAIPNLPPPNDSKSTAQVKPNMKPSAWWVTPPRGEMALPGARKRSSDVDPLSAKRVATFADKTGSFGAVPAKRTGSAPWQGRVKPLVRPHGMASSKQKAQPSIVNALLSDEQKSVLELIVQEHQSVFFTGAAGTGKSHILKVVVDSLRQNRYDSEVAVTATTGLAAFNIGGQTLHRWAGIRTGVDSPSVLVEKIKKNRDTRDNWRRCKVLVIDEVSMLDAGLLDKLEEIARGIRGNTLPFGGIQLVLTGDFFQLPPVGRSGVSPPLCFEAKCWSTVINHCIVLNRVFRQKDNKLIDMLNAMRTGNITPEINKEFEALSRSVEYNDGLEPTELYPVRWQVERANAQRLKALPGSTFTFDSRDSSDFDTAQKFFEQLMAPKRLELKIGAQVLLIRNLNDVLVNGRRGHIVSFFSEIEWQLLGPFLRDNQRALDVYNARLNAVAADNNDRVIDNAVLYAEVDELNFPDEGTKSHYLAALVSPLKAKLPVVDFRQGQVVLIDWVEFSSDGDSRFPLKREQLPLIPSWALSIHKSQGQTLDRVIVDLGQVFEAGQAYVAVSRATSYDRLQIKGFKRDKIRIHPRVAQFYKDIDAKKV